MSSAIKRRRSACSPTRFTRTIRRWCCGFGITTPNYLSLRLREARPLGGGRFFGGKPIDQPMTLNGGAGMDATIREPRAHRGSANSLMLTGIGRRQAPHGRVGRAALPRLSALMPSCRTGRPALFAEDPIGGLVDEDQAWMAHDTFYLDVHTRDPFEALERYGMAMRAANNACPMSMISRSCAAGAWRTSASCRTSTTRPS